MLTHVWPSRHGLVRATHSFISNEKTHQAKQLSFDWIPTPCYTLNSRTPCGTFLLECDTKLTDTAADGVLNETACALVLRVAAERAGCVGAEKVWSTVVGPQSTLIYI